VKNRKSLVPVVLGVLILAVLLDIATATMVSTPEQFSGVGGNTDGTCAVGVADDDGSFPDRWFPVVAGACANGDGYIITVAGGLTGIVYKQAAVMPSERARDAMHEVQWRDYYGEPSPYWDPETQTRTYPSPEP